ncbi:bacteriocin immunity protein [Enterobacter bugandensis]|uniref:bacteriocin immunity protein n=1 Tax=Enterobacter bugandensis TaxID=881260 RepID=UPI002D7972E1|nr:bacteriocin immunity protein [Enterobacter bugandensis]WRT53767.1 bacteriocin immunity protein [Enterobacter bugandensis]
MLKRSFSDYTENEFLEFVRKLFNVADTSESEDIKNILEFKRLTKHPDGSDLIFYPRDDREDSPEGVVQEI